MTTEAQKGASATAGGEERVALSALLREVLEGMCKDPGFLAYCGKPGDGESRSLESAA